MPPRLARPGLNDQTWINDPDGALVRRAQNGEREAFDELVRRNADGLYRVVRRLGLSGDAAEEVAQEAFLRAWRSIGSFQGNARFFTWLYRIGVNEAKRRLGRQPSRAILYSLDEAGIVEPEDPRDEPHDRLARAELRVALMRAVRELPLKYRGPLVLRDLEGLSTADGAAILKLSEAAFKSRLHRARVAVRDAVRVHFAD